MTDRGTITVNQLRADDGMEGWGGAKVRDVEEGGAQFIWISKERWRKRTQRRKISGL